MSKDQTQPLNEGFEKRGGINQQPKNKKPVNPPKPQKPVQSPKKGK